MSDGFGEYNADDVEGVIGLYEQWLVRRAFYMLPERLKEDRDDLVQEGRIAMWQAYLSYRPGNNLETWLKSHAIWRMKSIAHRRTHWTGSIVERTYSTSQGDRSREAIRKFMATYRSNEGHDPTLEETAMAVGLTASTVSHHLHNPKIDVQDVYEQSLDKLIEDRGGVEGLLEAADIADSVMWAYHQGEIAQALSNLSLAQRKYVYLRFWRGCQTKELKEAFGYEPHALWTKGAKPKLRRALVHLGPG